MHTKNTCLTYLHPTKTAPVCLSMLVKYFHPLSPVVAFAIAVVSATVVVVNEFAVVLAVDQSEN